VKGLVRKPLSLEITELLFADDGVIICCTRQGMEEAVRIFDEAAAEFGLVVKTKLLVAGSNLEEGYLATLYICDHWWSRCNLLVLLWEYGIGCRLVGHLKPLGLCMVQCFVKEMFL